MSRDLDVLSGFEAELLGIDSPVEDGAPHPDLDVYERICVATSGGKDSLAALLHLLDLGVPREKIELHHYRVDGAEDEPLLFDWACTDAYVNALAHHFRLPLYLAYKEGGLQREMLRENCGTAPITFMRGDGSLVTLGGDRSKPNTRRRFPQVSASLVTRWCSSVAKIECSDRMLINDPRFTEGKTLMVTGERADESPNRARYAVFEPNRADNRNGRVPRWIDHWRPVHGWSAQRVWRTIERHRIRPHPCYQHFSRASCMCCIFTNYKGWAIIRAIAPDRFEKIAAYEEEFGVTIHRTMSVREQADRGVLPKLDPEWVKATTSRSFDFPIIMDPWILPGAAYGNDAGPS